MEYVKINLDQNLVDAIKLNQNPAACIDNEIVKDCTKMLLQIPEYRKASGLGMHTFILADIPGLLGKHRKKMKMWRLMSIKFFGSVTFDVFLDGKHRLLLTDADGTNSKMRRYINRCAPEKLVRYLLEIKARRNAPAHNSVEDLLAVCRYSFRHNVEAYWVEDLEMVWMYNYKTYDEWEQELRSL